MNISAAVCAFLFLTVKGVWGSELTINVKRKDSVTLMCSKYETLMLCICPPYPERCNSCTGIKIPTSVKTSGHMVYYTLQGLEQRDSGRYVCYPSFTWSAGKVYKLNVLEGQDSTTVIGVVGQSIVMSCGTEEDIMAASEKHWCHLDNAGFCDAGTVLDPENKAWGDFKILDRNSSFSLEKQYLTHSDAGSYRFTMNFHNYTKVCEVKVQVRDQPRRLEIIPVQVDPNPGQHFEISCRYSQDLEDYYKYWICDDSECPETVKSVDDRFQSALILTIDHVGCSKIRLFQCAAYMQGTTVRSTVHRQPEAHIAEVVSYGKMKVQITAYSLLDLLCSKTNMYDTRNRIGSRYRDYDFDYKPVYWCRVDNSSCNSVEKNVKDTPHSLTLQICVTPNDDGATYRCHTPQWTAEVELVVLKSPLHHHPHPPPDTSIKDNIPSSSPRNVGMIVILSSISLLIITLSIAVIRCKGLGKLRQTCRLLCTRRTPLSAVDIDASMYANSVAHYYRQNHGQVIPADKQGQGDDRETSSCSDDEFEELPVCREETDYVRVKPGVPAHPQDTGGQGEVGYAKKKSTVNMVNKLQKNAAQRNLERSPDSEDEEDEVTYTHVTFKPKHRK